MTKTDCKRCEIHFRFLSQGETVYRFVKQAKQLFDTIPNVSQKER